MCSSLQVRAAAAAAVVDSSREVLLVVGLHIAVEVAFVYME